ncbi:MAG: PHP domain-containing protein [Clostridia bacterium]|nr:PHP domain-containing protein [Clostridia bacterium]MBQ3868801.1 PHP domain-containing protein [Clostridia bacterium]MBR0158029.1 PHP domain-containing protein [Clostridia bacterium]
MTVSEKKEYLIERLNNKDVLVRLEALRGLKRMIDAGEIPAPVSGEDVNNHIHTTYSFSPYSPTKAVWMAYNAGLKTAGIMDHDSLSGAREFIEAAKIVGILSTIGVECRASMKDTPIFDRRINNPDQNGVAYMALHGVPHQNIDEVIDFFKPYSAARNERNRKMVANINALTEHVGIVLDFDRDVVPLSNSFLGGSVTERHLLFALAKKITARFGKGAAVVDFLENDLRIGISAKVKGFLLDETNDVYEYDLLGALKSNMVEKFYIDADAECPPVREVLALGRRIGAISAYAYLGDVGDSVTGDKKTQKFEDSYIGLLFDTIKGLGFNAVTYMPSRNTMDQLRRVRSMCDLYGLFQISGEDINSPRQKFICEAQRNPEFSNLHDATLRLIRHEAEATEDITKAMFYVPGETVSAGI